MKINKNIDRALFQVEKLALLIISVILVVNLAVNGLVMIVGQNNPTDFYIEQMILNLFIFSFVYLMIYAINQVTTSIPFLVSLNCPKMNLAKAIVIKGLTRSLIIALILFMVKVIVSNLDLWLASTIFGLNLSSSGLTEILVFTGILYLLLELVYTLITLISLLGVRFGWESVLTAILLILGTLFWGVKPIVLNFIFGWKLNLFVSLLVVINAGLNFVNYNLIKNFEYKN